MTELGDVLARIHSGDDSWRTARAGVREWRHQPLISQAFRQGVEARDARRGETSVLFGPGERSDSAVAAGPAPPPVSETTGRLWVVDGGDNVLVRLEQDAPARPSLLVRRGTVWWSYDEVNGALTNNGSRHYSAGGDGACSLLYPARFLGRFRWRLSGEDDIGDRRCLVVSATDRELDEFSTPPFAMTFGGLDYQMWVDAERGVILRVAKFVDGEQAELRELVGIVFDQDLDPSLFELDPHEGVETLDAEAAMARWRRRRARRRRPTQ